MKQSVELDPGKRPRIYAAFLVRCRYEDQQWRFFLENVATREQKGFVGVEALCIYIQTLFQETAD